ncbi:MULTISPECIES: GNAT family N-acetyltransferase [Hymenobacter]|uniref:GNAT family N-acetyltransferase n=1 Tax=Hymenobacter TaxID=89966 RepID=UPI00160D99F8
MKKLYRNETLIDGYHNVQLLLIVDEVPVTQVRIDLSTREEEHECEFQSVHTHPEYWSKGYARYVLGEAIREAYTLGKTIIVLGAH